MKFQIFTLSYFFVLARTPAAMAEDLGELTGAPGLRGSPSHTSSIDSITAKTPVSAPTDFPDSVTTFVNPSIDSLTAKMPVPAPTKKPAPDTRTTKRTPAPTTAPTTKRTPAPTTAPTRGEPRCDCGSDYDCLATDGTCPKTCVISPLTGKGRCEDVIKEPCRCDSDYDCLQSDHCPDTCVYNPYTQEGRCEDKKTCSCRSDQECVYSEHCPNKCVFSFPFSDVGQCQDENGCLCQTTSDCINNQFCPGRTCVFEKSSTQYGRCM